MSMAENKKTRMANFELLRCIAMMKVVGIHFVGKGGFLPDFTATSISVQGYVATALECSFIVCINLYMLISGYFLVESQFSLKKVWNTWLQVMFYSVGIGVIAYLIGYVPKEGWNIYMLGRLVFPISKNHYWFMTAYLYMYLFFPLLAAGVKRLTKKQFQTVLCAILFAFCVVKSVVPLNFETDGQGYNMIWYLCVFLLAAYIRLYGIPFFKNKTRGFLVYYGGLLGIFLTTMVIRFVYLKTGILTVASNVAFHHNHIFVLLAGLGLFYAFLKIEIKPGKIADFICRISPYTLGVYLIHCHTCVEDEWPGWIFRVFGRPASVTGFLGELIIAILGMFVLGVAVDFLRQKLFVLIGRGANIIIRGRKNEAAK